MKATGKKLILIPIILLTAVLAALSVGLFTANAAYAADGAIVITKQPTDIKMFYGDSASLTVEAEYVNPQNLGYKWQFLADGATEENWVNKSNERVYGVKNPSDTGRYRCLIYDVENEAIATLTEEVTVTVNKAAVDIVIHDKASYFGDEEEELTYSFKQDLSEEERAKITVMPLVRANADHKSVGSYEITDSGFKSDYYTVKFEKGTYTIKKRPIKINVAAISSVYGEPIKEIPYEIGGGTLAGEDTLADLKIELTLVADGASVGKYPIEGKFDNANYDVSFRPASYTVTPKLLDVRLVGANDLIYNGEAPRISCEIIGEKPDYVTATVTFDKAVKNAGDYIAYVRTGNPNYGFRSSEIPFTVQKRTLYIGLDDFVTTEGAEFSAEFYYYGFVDGENEESLKSPPVLSNTPTSTGIYTVTPTGAVSDNYDIEYISATLQINVAKAESLGGEFTGSFAPNTYIDLSQDGREILDEHFKRIDRVFVYSVEIPSDGIYGEYTAKLKGVDKFVSLFLRACIVDEDGNKVALKSFGYDEDGNFVFTADSPGVLVIYYSLLVPVLVVAVFILIILIIVIKKRRDRKRYQRAYVKRYVARQYAEDMVNRNRENY